MLFSNNCYLLDAVRQYGRLS